jgi:hypothetical protein
MERYYSPRLRRELINPLYHEAKRQRIPMTELASRFVEDGLNRLRPDQSTIAEEPGKSARPDRRAGSLTTVKPTRNCPAPPVGAFYFEARPPNELNFSQ